MHRDHFHEPGPTASNNIAMTDADSTAATDAERSQRWTWLVCLVLLTATFLNYANRFAFTQNADRIQQEFQTNEEGYGKIAGYFGLGFAIGGLTFGILADVISVRLLYPAVVVIWSLAGISSGLVSGLVGLGVSQFILGLFEAGHWPCALRTTQRVFKPAQRTMGNSLLQSGASLGAVATPLLVVALLNWNPDNWRYAFFITGGVGLPWVLWWLLTVSEADLRRPVIQTDESSSGSGAERELQEMPFFRIFLTRRWWILLVVVVCINTFWHYIRVWMPLTLIKDHGYTPEFVGYFTSLYYLSTFFGSIACGWLTSRLARTGWNVHRSRLAVFLLFGVLSTLSIPAAFMSRGPLLLASLLVVAFGSLGLFPIYYSLNQELSAKNQGKVGGTLGFSTWGILFFVHPLIGGTVDHYPTIGELLSSHPLFRLAGLGETLLPFVNAATPTRAYLFAAVGLGPLLAFAVLALAWGQRERSMQKASGGRQPPDADRWAQDERPA